MSQRPAAGRAAMRERGPARDRAGRRTAAVRAALAGGATDLSSRAGGQDLVGRRLTGFR